MRVHAQPLRPKLPHFRSKIRAWSSSPQTQHYRPQLSFIKPKGTDSGPTQTHGMQTPHYSPLPSDLGLPGSSLPPSLPHTQDSRCKSYFLSPRSADFSHAPSAPGAILRLNLVSSEPRMQTLVPSPSHHTQESRPQTYLITLAISLHTQHAHPDPPSSYPGPPTPSLSLGNECNPEEIAKAVCPQCLEEFPPTSTFSHTAQQIHGAVAGHLFHGLAGEPSCSAEMHKGELAHAPLMCIPGYCPAVVKCTQCRLLSDAS